MIEAITGLGLSVGYGSLTLAGSGSGEAGAVYAALIIVVWGVGRWRRA